MHILIIKEKKIKRLSGLEVKVDILEQADKDREKELKYG
jgi:hypothetical protein